MKELWLPIEDFEGLYEISNKGRIKALPKFAGNSQFRTEKILSPSSCGKNIHIALYKDGSHKNYLLHRLVAQHFIGPIPKGYVINHLDNNPKNNNVKNLEIVTQSQNIIHCVSQGRNNPRPKRGSESPVSRRISAYKNGEKVGTWDTVKELKKSLGIKSNNIASVARGERQHLCGYTFKYY